MIRQGEVLTAGRRDRRLCIKPAGHPDSDLLCFEENPGAKRAVPGADLLGREKPVRET